MLNGIFYFYTMKMEELYQSYLESGRVFTDSRQAAGGGLFFALKGERFDGNDYALKALEEGASYAVVDRPGLAANANCIVVNNVLETLQQLARHHRKKLTLPVIGITGTNGKTTSKELITAVLGQKYKVLATSGNLNNHIGVPLTLLQIDKTHEIAIIEMGANHQGEIDFLCNIAAPDYGLITNVGKAHLEGFGSFEGVKKAKGELYQYIADKGRGIFINSDNEHLKQMASDNAVQYSYGVESEKVQLRGKLVSNDLYLVAGILFAKGWLYIKTQLTGAYNLENILAAARLGVFFELDPLLIQKGIEAYQPKNNRSQIMRMGTATFFLDCYNANPTSMKAALSNFFSMNVQPRVVVLGDMLELGDEAAEEHQAIADWVQNEAISEVYLVGAHFMNATIPPSIKCYRNIEMLKAEIPFAHWDNKYVLVKGSRAMQLENIVK